MTSVHIPRRILSSVAKPARYASGEWNSINKQTLAGSAGANGENLIRFAFCFPDTYEIGMSNLALRILYDRLNQRPDTWCERFFAPWKDMEQLMRSEGLPLFSIESRTPLAEYDLIGFTLQYELACTNVLNMLDLGGVPVLAADRGPGDPLVLAGGPIAYNIEPMADFFDLAVIGEGEEAIGELVDLYRDCRQGIIQGGRPDKEAFLLRAARLEGIYVPSFYDVSYHPDGTIAEIKRPDRRSGDRARGIKFVVQGGADDNLGGVVPFSGDVFQNERRTDQVRKSSVNGAVGINRHGSGRNH
jgi:radical SAM superfamily enzyme YgiQ (UPF0313 family)